MFPCKVIGTKNAPLGERIPGKNVGVFALKISHRGMLKVLVTVNSL